MSDGKSGVKERPILFSTPMVRAILEGRKTQTRRVCKNQPYGNGYMAGQQLVCHNDYLPPSVMLMDVGSGKNRYTTSDAEGWEASCPYGAAGDRLWVRETWAEAHPLSFQDGRTGARRLYAGIPGPPPVDYLVAYRADGERLPIWHCEGFPYRSRTPRDLDEGKQFPKGFESGWVPSIHMPRAASRINLELTGVRVERLLDISRADAIAEGLSFVSDVDSHWGVPGFASTWWDDPVRSYQALWTEINGAPSWFANPRVWVVEFSVLQADSKSGGG